MDPSSLTREIVLALPPDEMAVGAWIRMTSSGPGGPRV